MNLIKRLDASALLLNFLIWAILSLFGTRLFLAIFNYPTIGQGNWHIAHVLWGGIFMLTGIVIFLIFYGKNSIKFASIFSGIGWGLFIDEIGKYITRDNNYWFQPAIIFIYISFIILFFLYRILEKKSLHSRSSLWHELLENCEELIDNDLEKTEKRELLQSIKRFEKISSPPEKRILHDLKILVLSTPAKKDKYQFSLSQFVANYFKLTYNRLFKRKLVFYALFGYSLWYIIDKLIDTVKLFFYSDKITILQAYYKHYDFFSKADVYMITLKFIVEVIIAAFFMVGIYFWLRKKIFKGIKFYQWGLLINIFIGSLFKFYFEQFSGVFSLIFAIVIWAWLNSYYRERRLFLKQTT